MTHGSTYVNYEEKYYYEKQKYERKRDGKIIMVGRYIWSIYIFFTPQGK